MSDWAIRDMAVPYAFIQWKGTQVCADYHCLCGMFFHLDSDFAYAVQCPSCERRYEVSAHVELREIPADEQWDGCDVKMGTDATVDSWEEEDEAADTAAGLLKKSDGTERSVEMFNVDYLRDAMGVTEPTQRYLLFAGDRYYPSGGWKDFEMSFSSVELAVKAVKGLDDYDWWQVVDSETRSIVESEDTSEQW